MKIQKAVGKLSFGSGNDITLTRDNSNGSLDVSGNLDISGNLVLDSATNTTGSIELSTNKVVAETIVIKNNLGQAPNAIQINAAAGGIEIDSNGMLALNSSNNTINICNDNVNQNMNIGTNGERTITIGNKTGATKIVINASSGGIDISGNLDISGNFKATNVKGQFMSLNGITGDTNSTLHLRSYGWNACILGKNDTSGNRGTGAWQNKTYSSYDSSLTNDGFDVADDTGYMTIPAGTYMINCVVTGRQLSGDEEEFVLQFWKGFDELYRIKEQLFDAASEGTTYNNVVMSIIRKLESGTDYYFTVGSGATANTRLWSGGSQPYTNYCNFYRIG